jgi:hypothetical protein
MVARGYSIYNNREVIELGGAFIRAFYVILYSGNRKIGFEAPW